MLVIGAKLKSTKKNQRLLRPKEGGRGMKNIMMAVARCKIRTSDAHGKRSIHESHCGFHSSERPDPSGLCAHALGERGRPGRYAHQSDRDEKG